MATKENFAQQQKSSSPRSPLKMFVRQRSLSFDDKLEREESMPSLSERKFTTMSTDSLEETSTSSTGSTHSSKSTTSQTNLKKNSMKAVENEGLRTVITETKIIQTKIKSTQKYSSQENLSSPRNSSNQASCRSTPSPQIGSLIEYFTRLSTANDSTSTSTSTKPNSLSLRGPAAGSPAIAHRKRVSPPPPLRVIEMPTEQTTHHPIVSPSAFLFSDVETTENLSSPENNDETPTVTEDGNSNRQSTRSNSSDATICSTDELDQKNEQLNKQNVIIQETLDTEQTYTRVLFVLSIRLSRHVDSICRKDENVREKFYQLFSPLLKALKDLYELHNRQIVPQITDYLTEHRRGLAWAVFEEKFAKIESCYKAYYIAFDEIQSKIESFRLQNPLINEAMLEAQKELENLDPMTQLNCPNQRLVRYPLLMIRYMKYLEENSTDYEHTNVIKDEIERIARRCGEQLMITPSKCEDLRRRLDKNELLKSQTILWHGSVKKQSPRKYADIARRYLILLTDRILVCQESGSKLEFNRELSLKALTATIDEDRRTSVANSSTNTVLYPFRVHAVEKSYEFLTDQAADREVWVRKIQETVQALSKRPIVIWRPDYNLLDEPQLGTRAPQWINDLDVTRCQNCHSVFRTNITTSRHHCRACGRCICGSCSTKKLILSYCKNDGEVKVCDRCYEQLTGREANKNNRQSVPVTKNIEQMILFGDFYVGLSRNKVWIVMEQDFHLHVYGARLDEVKDFSIDLTKMSKIVLEEKTRLFTLQSPKRSYQFCIPHEHRIESSNNELLNKKLRTHSNALKTMTNLWHTSMLDAQRGQLPEWWREEKRVSSDSGFSEKSVPTADL